MASPLRLQGNRTSITEVFDSDVKSSSTQCLVPEIPTPKSPSGLRCQPPRLTLPHIPELFFSLPFSASTSKITSLPPTLSTATLHLANAQQFDEQQSTPSTKPAHDSPQLPSPSQAVTDACSDPHHNKTIHELPTANDDAEVDVELRDGYAADTQIFHTGLATAVRMSQPARGAASIVDIRIRGCKNNASSRSGQSVSMRTSSNVTDAGALPDLPSAQAILEGVEEVEVVTASADGAKVEEHESVKEGEGSRAAKAAKPGKKGSRKSLKRWSSQHLQAGTVKGIVRAFRF